MENIVVKDLSYQFTRRNENDEVIETLSALSELNFSAWFMTAGGKKVKVMECRVVPSNGEAPGTVLATKPLTVACGEGAVQLLHVVPEGKKPMDGTSFAAGLRLKTGDSL